MAKEGMKEVSLTYLQAFESYSSLKAFSNVLFGGDKPGQTKYRLCTIILKQLREPAEEFSAARDDFRVQFGEEDWERDEKNNYKLDPETKKKISIGKIVKTTSEKRKEFIESIRDFGKKEILNKITIPKDGIELTTIDDPGDILEPLDWLLSDVIFEEKKDPSIDILKTIGEIKEIMIKTEKKLK